MCLYKVHRIFEVRRNALMRVNPIARRSVLEHWPRDQLGGGHTDYRLFRGWICIKIPSAHPYQLPEISGEIFSLKLRNGWLVDKPFVNTTQLTWKIIENLWITQEYIRLEIEKKGVRSSVSLCENFSQFDKVPLNIGKVIMNTSRGFSFRMSNHGIFG